LLQRFHCDLDPEDRLPGVVRNLDLPVRDRLHALRNIAQAAMEALSLVADLGGPTMFARIAVMRTLNRHFERVFNPERKETHWGRRNLTRERDTSA
jgi:hypothetical protein